MGLTLDSEDAPDNAQTSRRDEAWIAQCPADASIWHIPAPEDQWLLACSWPPFFTIPLWKWLQQLRWQTRTGATPGVTGLELLVDFVIVTGTCPPVHATQNGRYLNVLDRNQCQPVTQRAWVQAILECARQLSRLSGICLIPSKRAKVPTLKPLGYEQSRNGLQQRPAWHDARSNLRLLRKVLLDGGVQPLIEYVRGMPACTEETNHRVIVQYHDMTYSARDRLGKRLRKRRPR